MRFPYRTYEVSPSPASGGADGCIHRPIIPFALTGPTGTLDFFGLLDTGADETYLTRQMAERLGLEIQQQSECTLESASGKMSVSYAAVVIELSDGTEIHRWRTTVGITDQDWAEAILGHSGFLEYFDVQFRGKNREVEITRNKAVLPSGTDEK